MSMFENLSREPSRQCMFFCVCTITLITVPIYWHREYFLRHHSGTPSRIRAQIPKPNWRRNVTLAIIVQEFMQQKRYFPSRPGKFLEDYKSPCWRKAGREGKTGSLQCLPAFYISGFPKCATTDLWRRLVKHPQIYGNLKGKEIFFWTLYFWKTKNFAEYVKWFSAVPNKFELTGEGTPFTLLQNNEMNLEIGTMANLSTKAKLAFGNREILPPHLITELTPSAKFIVSLREPGERVYSHYLNEHRRLRKRKKIHHDSDHSAEEFHKLVVERIAAFTICRRKRSFHDCVHRVEEVDASLKSWVPLGIGLYATYIRDVIKLVPWENMFIFRFEDYMGNRQLTVKKMLQFLEVTDDAESVEIVSNFEHVIAGFQAALQQDAKTRRIVRISDTKQFPMRPETRKLLTHFYRPFNEDLALLLEDNRYLFEDILKS